MRYLVIVSYPRLVFRGDDGNITERPARTYHQKFADSCLAIAFSVRARREGNGVKAMVIDLKQPKVPFSCGGVKTEGV